MKRALILAVPLLLAAAACSDDDEDSPDTTDSSATSVATEDTPTEDTEETSTDDTSTDDTLLPGGTALPGGTVLPGGRSLPGRSLPVDAEDIVRQVFPNLDDDQVSCLAENLGADIDPSRRDAAARRVQHPAQRPAAGLITG